MVAQETKGPLERIEIASMSPSAFNSDGSFRNTFEHTDTYWERHPRPAVEIPPAPAQEAPQSGQPKSERR